MAQFNLDDYEPVEERLQKYLKAHADARVITRIESNFEGTVVIKAAIYKSAEDLEKNLPHATGYAEETRGEGFVNKTSHIENCETSAIGRALANAGYSGNKNGQRASRQEMEKVQRVEQPTSTPKTETDCDHDIVTRISNSVKNPGREYKTCTKCKEFLGWVTKPKLEDLLPIEPKDVPYEEDPDWIKEAGI